MKEEKMTYAWLLCLVAALFWVTYMKYDRPRLMAKPQPTSLGIYRVTAYCPCEKCCGPVWADGMTACGHVIQPGDMFVAADRSMPIGTMLMVPGYGTVPVLDRGGVIKGNRLDVFFGDANGISGHQRALNWGVKHQEIFKGD